MATDISVKGIGLVESGEATCREGDRMKLAVLDNQVAISANVRSRVPLDDGRCRIGAEFEQDEPDLVDVLLHFGQRRSAGAEDHICQWRLLLGVCCCGAEEGLA